MCGLNALPLFLYLKTQGVLIESVVLSVVGSLLAFARVTACLLELYIVVQFINGMLQQSS